eukprot:TRINITY_DN13675_c0_g1_i1.p1 TRINITY_DN13675_c0_g1~~TRINITY_DN13675_c0_g1_i1.p1  ORF type:complete len:116 (-),score=16.48 TRINITY_DN13675_c0_g1_i1:1-348(-)
MQRGLVGSEMCIRDSINAEYMGSQPEYFIDIRDPVFKFCEKIQMLPLKIDKTSIRISHVTRDKLPLEMFDNGLRLHVPRPCKRPYPTNGFRKNSAETRSMMSNNHNAQFNHCFYL